MKKRPLINKIKQIAHRNNRYFKDAKEDIAKRNIQTMRLVCFFGLIVLVLMCVVSHYLLDGWRLTVEVILIFATFLGFFVYSSALYKEDEINAKSVQSICILFYAIMLALLTSRSVFSLQNIPDGYFYVVLILMPVLFTARPIVFEGIGLCFSVIFILLTLQLKAPEYTYSDIYCVILGYSLSIVITIIRFSFKIKDYFLSLKLLKSSQEDSLTGVLNKAGCEQSCVSFFDSRDKADSYTLFVIDVDNFKSINDNFGHQCGDKLLTMVGNSLLKVFRSSDVIGRIGGDEFCVLMKNTNNIDTVIIKAEAINRVVGEETKTEIKFPITCSIGIAVGQNNDIGFHEVFAIADKALYRAKSEGKNNYIIDLVE